VTKCIFLGFSDTTGQHHFTTNLPYAAEQYNPINRKQLGFDLNEPRNN